MKNKSSILLATVIGSHTKWSTIFKKIWNSNCSDCIDILGFILITLTIEYFILSNGLSGTISTSLKNKRNIFEMCVIESVFAVASS